MSGLRFIPDKQTMEVKLKLRFIFTSMYCWGPYDLTRILRFILMNISRKLKKKQRKKNPDCFRNRALNKSIKLIYKPIKMLND